MKKCILIVAAAILFLSSCSEKDNPTKSSIISKLEVACDVTKISQDVLTYYDIIYNYTDFQGESHSETINEPRTIKFKVDNPSLIDETSAPYPFTIEVVMQKKESVAEKREGEKYNSTFVYEITAGAQYVDTSVEPFSACCFTRASEWHEAPNFTLFSSVLNNLSAEKTKFNLCLENNGGVIKVKLVDLSK